MNDRIQKASAADKIFIILSNKDTVSQFLKEQKISKIDNIKDIQKYEGEDDRKGIILKVKETNNSDPIKILIDLKPGQPNISQVYDAVYETGADCDKRVVIYTGGKSDDDEDNPTADQYVIESLANAINDFPVGLYLVKKSESILSKGFLDFLVIEQPYGTPKFKENDLPSKQQFRELEFWQVYFWSLYDGLYRPWEAFSDGLDEKFNYGFSLSIKNLKIEVQWTKKEGVYYTVSREDDDYHSLEEVWIEKENNIRSIFNGAEIDMRKDPGKLPRITIKYWKFPPTVLLDATVEEKKDYAESLYRKYWALFGVIKSA